MKEIDLSIGAPKEPVSQEVRAALTAADWQVGYPPAAGSEIFKTAVVNWAKQALALDISFEQVMPVAGAKEFVGTLAWVLGLTRNSTIAIPNLSYPTYQDGAEQIGAKILRYETADDLAKAEKIDLLWINSPNNPTGEILQAAQLIALLEVAQTKNAVVVSDETYLETAIDSVAPSAFAIAQNQGLKNVLGLYSLSKRNSLAAFRVGYALGSFDLIDRLISVRRKLGLLANSPATQVASNLLADFSYPKKIREQFLKRREVLLPALTSKGFTNYAPGGMFLWLSNGKSGKQVVERFLALGIKVAPGILYGPSGENFVRISLTLTESEAEEVALRLKDF